MLIHDIKTSLRMLFVIRISLPSRTLFSNIFPSFQSLSKLNSCCTWLCMFCFFKCFSTSWRSGDGRDFPQWNGKYSAVLYTSSLFEVYPGLIWSFLCQCIKRISLPCLCYCAKIHLQDDKHALLGSWVTWSVFSTFSLACVRSTILSQDKSDYESDQSN